MKFAVFTESSIDDVAIKILIDAILGEETELIDPPRLEIRDKERGGCSNVIKHLENFFRHWYYQTETEASAIVIDSDDDPVHKVEHEEEGNTDEKCRLCLLRQNIARVQAKIKPSNREAIRTAIGVAVPAIEAWFRCLEDSHVNEVAWVRKLNGEKIGYDRKSLKKDVYGGERSPTREKSIESAKALINDLDQVEQLFPQGFGALVRDVKNWKSL